jgi:hypothetical protein
MGVTLSVEIGPDEEIPFWFTRTASEALRRHLWELYWNNSDDELVRLLEHLDLSLEPFKKIGEEEEPLESFRCKPSKVIPTLVHSSLNLIQRRNHLVKPKLYRKTD